MSDKIENPPAFPAPEGYEPAAPGMKLRDWFAGQAMAGLMAHHETSPGERGYGATLIKNVAEDSYRVADAMLAERNK